MMCGTWPTRLLLCLVSNVHTFPRSGTSHTNRPSDGAKAKQENDGNEEAQGGGAAQETPSSQYLTVRICVVHRPHCISPHLPTIRKYLIMARKTMVLCIGPACVLL